jgi:hypothetical protein
MTTMEEFLWTAEDDRVCRLPKICAECKKPITTSDSFWRCRDTYHHSWCAEYIPLATLDWRDMHG